MLIEPIWRRELRLSAGGSGVQGRLNVVYQVQEDGSLHTWDPGAGIHRPVGAPGPSGMLALPQRARDFLGGPIFVGGSAITLGFEPRSLVPLPAAVHATQLYVSPVGSDANNGSSWALAKRTINAGITLGNAGAVPYTLNVASGVYDRTQAFTTGAVAVVPTQACWVRGYGGQVICHTGGPLTWTQNAGTTYQATRSNVGRVLDLLRTDEYGDPLQLTKVSTLAACQATPGSWYTDGTTAYVNRIDGVAVADANTLALLHNVNGIPSSNTGNMWLTNFTQWGGSTGAARLVNNASGRFYAEDCRFLFANEGTGNAVDAVQSQNIGAAIFNRCTAAHADKDGFNFHTLSGSVPQALLVDCLGYRNGLAVGNTSCNGATMHDDGLLIDIRGRYTQNWGGDCAHTSQNTMALHIGTTAIRGYGDRMRGGVVDPDTGFHSINGAQLYLYGETGRQFSESGGLFLRLAAM